MADNVTPVVFKAKAKAFDEPREVLMIDYKFDQTTDREGQIDGIPRGGLVTIRVKAMNDGNTQLLQWMLNPTLHSGFTVTFYNTVDGSTMKELKGKYCYCIHYKEYWADGEEHYEEFVLSCQTLENGSVKYDNPWK